MSPDSSPDDRRYIALTDPKLFGELILADLAKCVETRYASSHSAIGFHCSASMTVSVWVIVTN